MKYFSIRNWEKYQHRDCTRSSGPMKFIRLEVALLDDEKMYELDTNSQLTWIKLLLYSGRTRNKLPHNSLFLQSKLGLARKPNLALFESLGLIEQYEDHDLRANSAQIVRKISRKKRLDKTRGDAHAYAHADREEKPRIPTVFGGGEPEVKSKISPTQDKQKAIALYCDEFKKRYEVHPVIRGKESGQLGGLLKEVGPGKLSTLIGAYFRMEDPWFLTKRHDVSTLLQNLNSISIFAETGEQIEPGNRATMRDQGNAEVMKRYLEREIK